MFFSRLVSNNLLSGPRGGEGKNLSSQTLYWSVAFLFKMAALYSCAANTIDKVLKKRGTPKSLAIGSHFPKKKKLYALVCETLKCK